MAGALGETDLVPLSIIFSIGTRVDFKGDDHCLG